MHTEQNAIPEQADALQKDEMTWGARIVSFLFHPLFIPTYLSLFLIYVNPYTFAGMGEDIKFFRALSVFIMTAFFPAFAVFLLWRLKFVSSVFLRTKKDRIIPYMIVMFFYFWQYYVSKNLPDDRPAMIWLMLGIFISSIAASMANIYCKISMHAIAMGNMIIFFLMLASSGDVSLVQLMLIVLVAGAVLSARLLISDHSSFEVYFGFLLGLACQLMAGWFINTN